MTTPTYMERRRLIAQMYKAEAEACSEPYCADNPRSAGTYEAYAGYLCGDCEDREAVREIVRRCEKFCDEDNPACSAHESAACVCDHGGKA